MKYFTLTNDGKDFEEATTVDIKEFIEKYAAYYLSDSDEKPADISIKEIKRINKTKQCVEGAIEKILINGISEPIDVKRILAWKLGNINMEETESNLKDDNQVFVYNTGWKKDKYPIEDKVSRPIYTQTKIQLEGLCNYVCGKSKDFPQNYGHDFNEEFDNETVINIVKNFFDEINDFKKSKEKDIFQGIGIVYSLTLLYFISQGRIPIYDKFVHIALKAIHMGKKPTDDVVYYSAPVNKKTNTAIALMEEYMWLIENTVGNELLLRKCIKNTKEDDIERIRKVDRALWVYGHLFSRT